MNIAVWGPIPVQRKILISYSQLPLQGCNSFVYINLKYQLKLYLDIDVALVIMNMKSALTAGVISYIYYSYDNNCFDVD